jgi:hypothetical protein
MIGKLKKISSFFPVKICKILLTFKFQKIMKGNKKNENV